MVGKVLLFFHVNILSVLVSNNSFRFSLEQDSHEHTTKVTPASGGLFNSHHISEKRQTEGEDCHVSVAGDGHDLKTLEESHNGIPTEMAGCIASNQNGNLDIDCDDGNASSEGSLQNHYFSEKHINSSADAAMIANQPLHPATSQQNGTLLVQHESLTARNNEKVHEKLGISNNFSKSMGTQTVVLSANGVHTALEPEKQNIEIGNRPVSDQPLIVSSSSQDTGATLSDVKSDKHENATDNDVSSSNGSVPAESGVICLYQCCPACLHGLYHLTKKILLREWGMNGDQWSVEDVHDAVATLSVDLISTVRKSFVAEDFIASSNETSRHETSLDCWNQRTCNAENQDKDLVPVECISHSASEHATAIEDGALNDLKFVFRDGVLVHMDPDKDVSVHCKFQNLSLCSLRELIIMTKRPFD